MKISVIIPVYNQKEEYFKECIHSIINQTRKPDEIIIIDDGSDKPIIEDFTSSTDIKIIRNKKNMGVGYSRQRGVDEATGDYIAFLSSDDIWDEKFLEVMIKTAIEQPGKILFSFNFHVNAEGKIIMKFEPPNYEDHEDFCLACLECAYRNTMFVNFSTTFFPKEVFEKVQFNKNLRFGEDLDFLLKSMKHFKYHLVPQYLLKYRVVDNLTSRIRHKIGDNNEKIIKEVLEYWKNG